MDVSATNTKISFRPGNSSPSSLSKGRPNVNELNKQTSLGIAFFA